MEYVGRRKRKRKRTEKAWKEKRVSQRKKRSSK